jgi:predicted aldo/keto reductase-like oxidoreductase
MLEYGLSVAEIREEQPMEYARLGNTGLMVSELCLGCMTFGQEADEETSREIVCRFLDAGGNFLDTADVYSNGVSEEITGKALRDPFATTSSWPRRSASLWGKARTMSVSRANT